MLSCGLTSGLIQYILHTHVPQDSTSPAAWAQMAMNSHEKFRVRTSHRMATQLPPIQRISSRALYPAFRVHHFFWMASKNSCLGVQPFLQERGWHPSEHQSSIDHFIEMFLEVVWTLKSLFCSVGTVSTQQAPLPHRAPQCHNREAVELCFLVSPGHTQIPIHDCPQPEDRACSCSPAALCSFSSRASSGCQFPPPLYSSKSRLPRVHFCSSIVVLFFRPPINHTHNCHGVRDACLGPDWVSDFQDWLTTNSK